jgi:hypothetical protein
MLMRAYLISVEVLAHSRQVVGASLDHVALGVVHVQDALVQVLAKPLRLGKPGNDR